MTIKSLLGALAFVLGAIAGAVWIVSAMPGASTGGADAGGRVVGSARPEGLFSGLVKKPAPAPTEAEGTQLASRSQAEEPELDAPETGVPREADPAPVALASSEPDPRGAVERPAPPAEGGAFAGAAVVTLCKGAGFACGSSAECCPGLACAGGVAGYGTPGRCQGDTAR
jgi:hypothetical protein